MQVLEPMAEEQDTSLRVKNLEEEVETLRLRYEQEEARHQATQVAPYHQCCCHYVCRPF